MILQLPSHHKTHELTNSIIWIDEERVLYSMPKKSKPVLASMEEIQKEMDFIRSLCRNQKMCIIIESDARNSAPPKEQRDLIAREITSVTKALAILTTSPLSRMAANIFFNFRPPAYPYAIFSDLKKAQKWIQSYVND
jgi:hypothetical protein